MEMNIFQPPLRDKRWKVKGVDEDVVKKLRDSLKIHPSICLLLAQRGITNFEEAKRFFRPQLSELYDPFLMKGMREAVDRIAEAVEWNEKILIYGDYDVDGTTAVAILFSFLKQQYAGKLSYYIPHRYREGYGVSSAGIQHAIDNGYTLIITLDCGIKSADLIEKAQKHGIDVIICDHHLPDIILPAAKAILNPKQVDCPYPFKELSGCGIGFKLICALCIHWNVPLQRAYEYLDLVATSIAADIVGMDDENRILAFYGLKKANENPSAALTALKNTAGITRQMHIADLVFVIGPRVNAAGRIDDATRAVDLFVETDLSRIESLAQELQGNNNERKEHDKQTTIEALQMLQNDENNSEYWSTVVYDESWHKGVVGIVASRLIDHYYRPTIVLTKGIGGLISGSGRSIKGFNIYNAIHECADLLESYGGHFFAAGLSLQEDKLPLFKQRFEETVRCQLDPLSRTPEIEIDAEIQLKDINYSFFNIISQMEPYGPNNLRPVFLTKRVYNYRGLSRVVNGKHLKIHVHQHNGFDIDGIGFGMEAKENLLNQAFDIVYTLEENTFKGNKSLQLKLIDIKPSL